MTSATDDLLVVFGPFRLDPANARLMRAGRAGGQPDAVPVTPKAFEVLCYLASRPNRLVSKDDLLSAIWPDVMVGDASVKVAVAEVRRALGDDATRPRYIETAHRRGYRFVAKVRTVPREALTEPPTSAAGTTKVPEALLVPPPLRAGSPPDRPELFGRAEELDRLRTRFDRALLGERQCVLLTGDAGSGKTALVQALIGELREHPSAARQPLVLSGHCFEQFGTAEPYMPVWEALARMAREQPTPMVNDLLARHAASAGERGDGSLATRAAEYAAGANRSTSDRLLRELADVIEACATDRPVLLLLEDIHWADHSTLDLITAIARRRSSSSPCRLMLLCTCRLDRAGSGEHALSTVLATLLSGTSCVEVQLRPLDQAAVAQLVSARLPDTGLNDRDVAERLHRRTSGHPLFLTHLVDDLLDRGLLADDATPSPDEVRRRLDALDQRVPRTARVMIEMQLARLDSLAREVLDGAAVVGVTFTAEDVAAALDGSMSAAEVEQVCESLSRFHRFIEPVGGDEGSATRETADATAAAYRFAHELYHDVVYQLVAPTTRVRMHHTLGVRLESAAASRAGAGSASPAGVTASAEIAVHFERSRDWARALRHLRHAAESAIRHYAHCEAAEYLGRALAAFDRLPPAERDAREELDLLMALAVNLQVTRGCAVPDVERLHARAQGICRSLVERGVDLRESFPVLWSIWVYHKVRSNLDEAHAMSRQLLAIAMDAGEDGLIVQAHQAMCVTALCRGHPVLAREQMHEAAARYDPHKHAANALRFGQDPGVASQAFGAVACLLLGQEVEAVAASGRAMRAAAGGSHRYTEALATHFAAMLHQMRGDVEQARQLAQRTLEISHSDGFAFWRAGGTVIAGWADAMRASAADDIAAAIGTLRRGIELWNATGSRTYHPYHLGLLGESLLRAGAIDDASRTLDEALASAEALHEGLYLAELNRLRAMCHDASCEPSLAAARRDEARRVAGEQAAVWFARRLDGD